MPQFFFPLFLHVRSRKCVPSPPLSRLVPHQPQYVLYWSQSCYWDCCCGRCCFVWPERKKHWTNSILLEQHCAIRRRELSFSLLYLAALCLVWPQTCINCLIIPTIFHLQLEMESKCTHAKERVRFHPFWSNPGSLFISCPSAIICSVSQDKRRQAQDPRHGREGQSRVGQQHMPAAPLTVEGIPRRSPVISAVPLDLPL